MKDKDKPYYQSHWIYLFHALILLLIMFPYLDPHYATKHPKAILFVNSAVIMTIIYSVSPNMHYFAFGCIIGAPAVISFWFIYAPYAFHAILISTCALYLYAICMTIRFLINSQKFTANQLFAATSVYILIGLTWTTAYQGIELINPGSFFINDVQNVDNVLSWSDFIYYSFTTLTTLGYGDITPLHPAARSLAILEAVTGVIFIPVIISGIVSIVLTEALDQRRKKERNSS